VSFDPERVCQGQGKIHHRKDQIMTVLKKLIGAATVAMLLTTGAHATTPLSDKEKTYIIAVTAATIVAEKCHAILIKDSAIRLADKTGIDFVIIGSAIVAAINANSNLPYDRSDLIPEVTHAIVFTALDIHGSMRLDQVKTCQTWITGLQLLGMVQ
jgi:hypothetical protein